MPRSVHLPWMLAQKLACPLQPGWEGSHEFPNWLLGLPSFSGGMNSAVAVREIAMVSNPKIFTKKVGTTSRIVTAKRLGSPATTPGVTSTSTRLSS